MVDEKASVVEPLTGHRPAQVRAENFHDLEPRTLVDMRVDVAS